MATQLHFRRRRRCPNIGGGIFFCHGVFSFIAPLLLLSESGQSPWTVFCPLLRHVSPASSAGHRADGRKTCWMWTMWMASLSPLPLQYIMQYLTLQFIKCEFFVNIQKGIVAFLNPAAPTGPVSTDIHIRRKCRRPVPESCAEPDCPAFRRTNSEV